MIEVILLLTIYTMAAVLVIAWWALVVVTAHGIYSIIEERWDSRQ